LKRRVRSVHLKNQKIIIEYQPYYHISEWSGLRVVATAFGGSLFVFSAASNGYLCIIKQTIIHFVIIIKLKKRKSKMTTQEGYEKITH